MEINNNSIDVYLYQEENYIVTGIKFIDKNVNSDNFQYAFYLLLDNVRVDTKYYTKENCVKFLPPCNGKYSTVGFIKIGEEKTIKKSDNTIEFKFNESIPVEECERNISISIFGSCVSRDIFNFDLKKKFQVKTYVARQSIVSAVSEPILCNIDDINLKSKFQREAVYNDFVKETFNKFKNDESDYLMIDLIDERFKIAKYDYNGVNSFVTYSALLDESGYLKNPNIVSRKRKVIPWKEYYIDDKKLSYYMDIFCEKVLSIFKSENIIIHKGKMLNFYKDKNGNIVKFPSNYILNNRKVNDMLNYMYDYLEGRFSNCSVMDFCDEYCAEEGHVWGLAPMHYQKEYYERALIELTKIMNGGGQK